MYSTIRPCGTSIGCKHMAFIITVLFITSLITLIDAKQEMNTETDSNLMAEPSKRAGFLPSRGRRFWSIFDWDGDSSEKRTARFLPMRGRKAGFLPMRGKKSSDQLDGDYVDVYPVAYDTGREDMNFENLEKRSAFMPSRGKKAFHAMRGKKSAQDLLEYDSSNSNNNFSLDKKSRNFFGMRG